MYLIIGAQLHDLLLSLFWPVVLGVERYCVSAAKELWVSATAELIVIARDFLTAGFVQGIGYNTCLANGNYPDGLHNLYSLMERGEEASKYNSCSFKISKPTFKT